MENAKIVKKSAPVPFRRFQTKPKRLRVANSSDRRRLFTQANSAWDRDDTKTAFSMFTAGAKLGDPACQVDLGYFYDLGISVPKNKRAALKWYREAYRQNDAGAANNIATIHRDFGEVSKMLWWYRLAAKMGDIDALFLLADRYENGKGVQKNAAKAAQFYAKVLERKNQAVEDRKRALAGLRRTGQSPERAGADSFTICPNVSRPT